MNVSRYNGLALAIVAGLVGLMLVAAACGDGEGDLPAAMTRTFYMEAIEPKGSANVATEAFPDDALPPGGGYALKEPAADGKWEVETYVWNPKQIVVNEGDTVKLEILGVNGASHAGSVDGYVESFVVERGRLTTVSFVADAAGVFKITCDTHQPSMSAELVVLPRA